MIFRVKYFAVFLLTLVSFNSAQRPVRAKIDSIISATRGLTAIGVKIIDADKGTEIYSINSDKPITPASTVKLYTTAAALDLLGKNFSLSLKVLANEYPEHGEINGDLIIKGFANPFVTETDIDSLVALLYASGLRKITGDIIGDDSYFDKNYYREHWVKGERTNVNTPPVSALILNRNEIKITFVPKDYRNFSFDFSPASEFYSVNFTAEVLRTRRRYVPKIKIITRPKKIEVNIDGKIKYRKRKFAYFAFTDNPPLFVANLFYEKLLHKGVEINGEPRASAVSGSVVTLLETKTSLENVIEKADKESDNFLAEIIFKTLAAEYCGCAGNSFYGVQAIYDFLERKNIDKKNIVVLDGSGISQQNKLTANSVVSLLSAMYRDYENFNVFYSSLAAAGTDGTLEERLNGFGLKNNFHGKTGTLNGVSALSGYFTTLGGKNVIVSILMNFNAGGAEYFREIQDEIIVELTLGY